MGRHALVAIVAFLLILLGVCGLVLYKYASAGNYEILQNQNQSDSSVKIQEKDIKASWIDQLASVKKPNFTLPVNEIFIEFKREARIDSTREAFLLLIDKNDIYSLFCVKEVLGSLGIDFAIVKDLSKSQIYLNTADVDLVQKALKELKKFDINSKVREVRL